jgi:endonuclease YncB( thermonuclease family)
MASRRYRRPRPARKSLPLTLLLVFILALAYAARQTWPEQTQLIEDRLVELTSLSPRPTSPPMAGADFTCRVVKVNDGDTLRCADGTRVRLHAVAARESDETCSPNHPCPTASAAASTRVLTQLASGKTLSCLQTGQSYNRVTAICWTPQGVEINCAMIQSGTTVVWDRFNREDPICRS